MVKLCGNCRHCGEYCVELNPVCQLCFYELDDNGVKTKPNFRPKNKTFESNGYHSGKVRCKHKTGYDREKNMAIANDPRDAKIVAAENKITESWVYNLRKNYKAPAA